MRTRHVFGPVPSRRLGVSLGIDLVEHKTCSLDCVYCECGPTTEKTLERKPWVDTDRVILEIDHVLGKGPNLDFVTFSGAGEPLLNQDLGRVAGHIKSRYGYRLALLTNSSLFFQEDVRQDAALADKVIASLDAAGPEAFSRVNRPHPDLGLEAMLEGLKAFRADYSGELLMEVFLVKGLNDQDRELSRIHAALKEIRPDGVQINTLDRPGAEDWVRAPDAGAMDRAMEILEGACPIRGPEGRQAPGLTGRKARERLLDTISRRPMTIPDMARSLGMHEAEARKHISGLLADGLIQDEELDRGRFFKTIKKQP